MRRRHLLALAGLPLLAAIPPARAAGGKFDAAAFAAAQAAGKPILVDIWASWCSTCAKQGPILSKLLADPAMKGLVAFRVDFDTQKDAVQALGARNQSTLIVFRGREERGRSVGDTAEDSIRALLLKAVG